MVVSGTLVWAGESSGAISTLGVGEGRLQELRKKSITKQANEANRSEDFFNIKTLRWVIPGAVHGWGSKASS